MYSTAKPTKMLRILKAVQKRDNDGEPSIKGRFFKIKYDVENHYHKEELPIIPHGTIICADFAGDFGMYATADVGGVLHHVKIELHELHKIDFGDLE